MQRAGSLEKTQMLGKIEGKRRRWQQRIRWLHSTTNSMNMNLNKFREIVKDREGWFASIHEVIKSWTWFSDWTTMHNIYISSVQLSRSVVSDSLRPCESQQARPPCPAPTPGAHSDSRPSSQWCHPAISSSVVPFSSCLQSLPTSESFPKSQLFAWGGQSTGVSALTSFLPKKSQGWSPSEWTGWISLHTKGLSKVFSNTTVQKHQFFGAQLSS